jgi:lysophospholipase L1-like esterase
MKYIDAFKAAAAAVRGFIGRIAGPVATRAETAPRAAAVRADATFSDEDLVEIAALLLGEIKAEAPVGVVFVPLLEYRSGGRTEESARSAEARTLFAQAAARAGVPLVDLGPALRDQFLKTGRPPAGFSNTAPGEGHLNAEGHVLLARAIASVAEESRR